MTCIPPFSPSLREPKGRRKTQNEEEEEEEETWQRRQRGENIYEYNNGFCVYSDTLCIGSYYRFSSKLSKYRASAMGGFLVFFIKNFHKYREGNQYRETAASALRREGNRDAH
jgi:hypothetical protein